MGNTEEPIDGEMLRGHITDLQNRIQHLENTVRDLFVVVSRLTAERGAGSGAARPLDAMKKTSGEEPDDGGDPSAYTMRFVRDPQNVGSGHLVSELEVNDRRLILLLEALIAPYPGISFDGDVLTIQGPFPAIVSD